MYGFRGSALGFAAASWQWQPTPHDPSNIIELSDVATGSTQTLTGTLFSDSDSFGAGVISTSITLTGTLFTNSNSFGAGSIGTTITLTGTLFSDGDSFGAGAVSTSITISGALYDDADTFGAGTISQTGPQTITGTLFVDDDSFGAGSISATGGTTETLTGGGLKYLNPRKPRIVDDDEENEKPLEVVKIGEGKPSEIITGIVQPPRRTQRTPKSDTLTRLEAQRQQAEAANRDRIRRIIQQDDEWLMMA